MGSPRDGVSATSLVRQNHQEDKLDIDVVSGAGGTVSLGGRLLTVRQLKMGDVGRLVAWTKERLPRPMKVATDEIMDILPLREADREAYEAAKKEILLSAREKAKLNPMEAYPKEAEEAMSSVGGVAYLLWLSVRNEHPDITYEWLTDALDDEDLGALKDKLDIINREWMKGMPGAKKNETVPTPG
jgi:hypothetical protein